MKFKEDVISDSQSKPIGKNYLVLVAVDNYSDGISSLDNPVRDAKAIGKCLTEKYQFETDNCFTLYNEKATRESVISLFEELQSKMTDQDNLVLFFSGHGKETNGAQRGYWMLSDAKKDNISTYLPNCEVKESLKYLEVRHLLLIIDSCFSGMIFRGDIEIPMSRLFGLQSRFALTSGRHDERVLDGIKGKHSPFLRALLRELNTNSDKGLWIGDLYRILLKEEYSKYHSQLPRGDALKELGHEEGEFFLIPKGKSMPTVLKDDLIVNLSTREQKRIGNDKLPQARPPVTYQKNTEDFEEIKDKLIELLTNLEWRNVFNQLKEALEKGNKRKSLMLLIGRYNRLMDLEKSGVGTSELMSTSNRISRDLTNFIEAIEARDLRDSFIVFL